MKIFVLLLVLIAFCVNAQAYSIPSTNMVETDVKTFDTSGYGENYIIETNATENVLEEDAKSHPVETEPTMITTAITNSIIGQNSEKNIESINYVNNNGSYTVLGIALLLMILIAVAIYNIRK